MVKNNINQTIIALTWFKTITVENERMKRTLASLSKGPDKAFKNINILQALMYILGLYEWEILVI